MTQGGDLIAEGKISVVHRKEESKAAAAAPVSDGDAQPGPPHPPDDPETGTQPVQVASLPTTLPDGNTSWVGDPAAEHLSSVLARTQAPQRASLGSWMQVEWPHGALSTLDADAFYRQVLRTGIRYGPRFRMLLRKAIDGSAAVLRCAGVVRGMGGWLQPWLRSAGTAGARCKFATSWKP